MEPLLVIVMCKPSLAGGHDLGIVSLRSWSSFVIAAVLFVGTGFTYGQDLTGRWQGNWQSQSTGHHGSLAATFQPTSPNTVQANFHGRFAGVIPFRYSVPLQVVQAGPVTVLSGQSRLPLFGTFHYTAVSNGQSFRADYRSLRDTGVFTLNRANF